MQRKRLNYKIRKLWPKQRVNKIERHIRCIDRLTDTHNLTVFNPSFWLRESQFFSFGRCPCHTFESSRASIHSSLLRLLQFDINSRISSFNSKPFVFGGQVNSMLFVLHFRSTILFIQTMFTQKKMHVIQEKSCGTEVKFFSVMLKLLRLSERAPK